MSKEEVRQKIDEALRELIKEGRVTTVYDPEKKEMAFVLTDRCKKKKT